VIVHESHGLPLSIFIDGVECGTVGSAAWEGALEEGTHEVFGKSATLTTTVQRFTVTSGGTVSVELSALPRALPSTAAPVGAAPVEPVPEVHEQTVSPVSPVSSRSGPPGPGPYGGFEAQVLFEPSGTHSDICSASGSAVSECQTTAPIGGGLLAYAGYAVAPLGIDAMVGFQADGAGVSGKLSGMPVTLTVPRIGGIFAVRGRVSLDSPPFSASLAVGFGAAVRHVIFVALGATAKTYTAPGIVVDAAVHVRFAPINALSLGLFLWGENPGNDVSLKVAPLPSDVHVVRSTQFFALPYLGIEFGP
jgi:hypothetical protein